MSREIEPRTAPNPEFAGDEDVVFVQYVPPPQDEEIWVIPHIPYRHIWLYEDHFDPDAIKHTLIEQ